MERIKCNLFGPVTIYEGAEEIFIPSGKVSELLYYLLIKKTARREELVGLLWPDTSEDNGKNSLRNTLHKLKKYFKANLILTPTKAQIVLNEAVDLKLDIDEFMREPLDNLPLYVGDLAAGAALKSSLEYEYWLMEVRAHYREVFINSAQRKIQALYEGKQFAEMETLIRHLLMVDGFNETAFHYLLKYYRTQGRFDKIINEYYHLQKILEEELGIAPPEEIEELFQEARLAVRKKDMPRIEAEEAFFYREYEFNQIKGIFQQFAGGAAPAAILLKGETGAGKSTVKKRIRQAFQDQLIFLETQCSLLERAISYSPWMRLITLLEAEMEKQRLEMPSQWKSVKTNLFFDLRKDNYPDPQILETFENFNSDLIFKSIQSALKILGEKKKTVIILEDIQWSDQYSLRLLLNLMLNSTDHALFFVTTADETGDHTEKNLNTLADLNKLAVIELKRFSQFEVTQILKDFLKDRGFTQELAQDLYEKSKGNAFFLKVYLDVYLNHQDEQAIYQIMQNILKEKFAGLSELEMKILRLIAVYNGDLRIEFILELLDLKAFDLVDAINELVRFNILEETSGGDSLGINFTHSSYRDYIYGELKETTKRIMHREIGQALERKQSSRGGIQSYLKLRYHFQEANDPVKSLKYEVIMLYYQLNFSHELFPAMDDFELSKQINRNINNQRALGWIREVEAEILRVANLCREEEKADMELIESRFFYCKGRYLIRCGNYQEGTRMIQKVIAMAKRNGDMQSELLGHKQMIIYGIQTNDPESMMRHIVAGIKAARQLDDQLELAVHYRLYGVYHLMLGQGGTAEVLFQKSISLMQATDRIANVNSVNLAANYNYLGEIRLQTGAFTEAMEYFNQAITMCETIEPSSLSIFYVNAGKTCYLMHNPSGMGIYLAKAKKIVDQFDSFWKKPVLESLLALQCFHEGDYAGSLNYLKNSAATVGAINNPRDIGMVYFVQGILRKQLEALPAEAVPDMLEFLKEPSSVYFYQAVKYLDDYRDKAEIDYLKELM